jgi:hypothetical protein
MQIKLDRRISKGQQFMRDRLLFIVAAIFNWTGVALLLFGGDQVFRYFGTSPPPDPVCYYLCLLAVVLFGIGYFCVGCDPSRNHALVAVGAIGKLAVFSLFLFFCARNWVPYGALGIIGFDAVFAAMFIEFLLRRRLQGAPRTTV